MDPPWDSMARSQWSNPRGPLKSNFPDPPVLAFCGALVPDSPMISVVMPWVILLTSRPSPTSSGSREWLWMSMNPGATT